LAPDDRQPFPDHGAGPQREIDRHLGLSTRTPGGDGDNRLSDREPVGFREGHSHARISSASGQHEFRLPAITQLVATLGCHKLRAGIIDPTKMVRTALQDASSVAGPLVTTEAMVAALSEQKPPPRVPAMAAWSSDALAPPSRPGSGSHSAGATLPRRWRR
jgi:hypothetical protein